MVIIVVGVGYDDGDDGGGRRWLREVKISPFS
jgi:hypothetical protein